MHVCKKIVTPTLNTQSPKHVLVLVLFVLCISLHLLKTYNYCNKFTKFEACISIVLQFNKNFLTNQYSEPLPPSAKQYITFSLKEGHKQLSEEDID